MSTHNSKEPLLALMLTVVLTGLGQIYARKIMRGIIFFSISLVCGILTILYLTNPSMKLSIQSLVFLPFLIGFNIFVMIDAYLSAKEYNSTNNLQREITVIKKTALIFGILFFLFVFNPLQIISTLCIRANFVQAFKIPSGALEPTILRGDRIFADKMVYRKSDPRRGDIIVYVSPEDPKKDHIKRIVGLPSETIEIKSGAILINNSVLKEPATIVERHYYNAGDYGKEGVAVKIPENCYYVLGDKTTSSRDSRYFGFVPRNNIIGKAYKIYYPFDRSGPIE